MFIRLRKHRRYDYTPRFYKPETAKTERRQKIRFEKPKRKSGSRRLMIYGAAFVALMYILLTLSQSGQ